MNKLFKRTVLSAAIITTLGLTACGGGSSSDSDSFTSADASGTAAKGIISGGIITAVELNTDQTIARELGSTTTAIDGSYELTIPDTYEGGPVQLTLSSNVSTQMKCDVAGGCGDRTDGITDTDTIIDFGEWYKPGDGSVEMTALIPSATSGASLAVNITPFTHMAAVRAKTSATLDSDAISNANSEVTALLGVNVLQTEPVDITDNASTGAATAQQVAYAALSSAVANIASADGTDVQTAINNLAASFDAGVIVGDDDDTDPTNISLQDIIDGASATLTAAVIEDTSGVISELQDDATTAGTGTIDPEPTDSATLSAVDKAKALVQDFRTYAYDMQATVEDPNFATSFTSEVEAAGTLLANMSSTDNPMVALGAAYEIYDNVDSIFTFDANGNANQTIEFNDQDPSPFDSGSMTLIASIDDTTGDYSGTLTFNDAVAGSQTANLTFTLDGNSIDNSSDSGTTYSNSGSETENIQVNGSIASSNTSLTLNGNIDTSYNYDAYHTYATNPQTMESIENRTINITTATSSLSVTPASSSSTVIFEGAISGNLLSNYAYSDSWDENDPYAYNYVENEQFLVKSLDLDGSVSVGSEVIALNVTASMPNAEDFYNTDTAVMPEETVDSYLQMSAGVGLTVDLTDLQDVDVNLAVSRTALDQATAELTLSHGNRSLVVNTTATIQAATAESIDEFMGLTLADITAGATVTSQDGAVMVITPSTENNGTIATLSVDNVTVGTVEETTDGLIKVSYEDGTFEIF